MYSIWVESSSKQLTQIKKVIKTLSEEENTDYFEPHVTLATNLNSEHSAMNVFDKISKKRFDITFDTIQEGTTYFQRLFLTSTDNTNFQNSIIDIEGWPSLWVPHLSLFYGNELPKSYPSKDFDNLIPVTVTFDTLVLSETGPIVSKWKEITTLFLD
ncbi:MAG: hypothetical protein VYC78_00760 [Actinomycetota bacterium]|nr:hypothetical protein [Actinomycetota bacterium]